MQHNFYSILINSCDKFEDCWNPFFKLFTIYWPDCRGKIFLNTEYKDYEYSRLNIISLRVSENHKIPKNKHVTWSQCLKWALEAIDQEIILYMQEDYFLKDFVKNELVEKYVHLMHSHPDIQCIHLTDQAVKAECKSQYENLQKVTFKQRYRISCQAAIWRKSELLDLIRENENAWEFEEFGSMRSAILKRDYYVVDKALVQLNKFEIIPYLFTGVIQGRWSEKTIPLFETHNISINFSERGFVVNAPRKPFLKRVTFKLRKVLKCLRNQIELNSLKRGLI